MYKKVIYWCKDITIYFIMNKSPVVIGSFREVQIVNGQVVKNVELVEQVSPDKDVIKGSINGKPVFITHNLKRRRTTKKRTNKKITNNKRTTKKRTNKRRSTNKRSGKKTTPKK